MCCLLQAFCGRRSIRGREHVTGVNRLTQAYAENSSILDSTSQWPAIKEQMFPRWHMSSPPSEMTLPTTFFTSRHRIITSATITFSNPDRYYKLNSFSRTGLSTRSHLSPWFCRPHCNNMPSVSCPKAWRISVPNECVLAWPHVTGVLVYPKTLNLTAQNVGDACFEKHPSMASRRSHFNGI